MTVNVTTTDGCIEATLELLEPPKRLLIFGSGDDVRPVATIGASLGWDVCLVGRRAVTELSPSSGLQQFVSEGSATRIEELVDDFTDVLLMTHDLNSDVEILSRLLETRVRSIGSLGSKNRLARLITELYRRGYTAATSLVERIRCPVGLNIGAIGPEEIAVSIAAELIALDHGRSCPTNLQREGTLHSSVPHLELDLEQLESIERLCPQPSRV